MRKLVLSSLAESSSMKDFRLRYELHCINGPELKIPDFIRLDWAKNGVQQTFFIIDTLNDNQPIYDWNEDYFEFTANFGQSPCRVGIPGKYIMAVIDDFTQETIAFGTRAQPDMQEQPTEVVAQPVEVEQEKPKLSLVSSNPDIVPEKSKAQLSIVKPEDK